MARVASAQCGRMRGGAAPGKGSGAKASGRSPAYTRRPQTGQVTSVPVATPVTSLQLPRQSRALYFQCVRR